MDDNDILRAVHLWLQELTPRQVYNNLKEQMDPDDFDDLVRLFKAPPSEYPPYDQDAVDDVLLK